MTKAFSDLLATRDWLLADGGTGTALFSMGLQQGEAPELWNEDHPDRIAKLYHGAIETGSDLFLTNSFGGNAARLKRYGAESRVRDLNRIAAEIGREVADQAERTAGSIGPTGEMMLPMGPMTYAEAVEIFHEQTEGLKEGGADVLWIETISALEEYRAAGEAATKAGMPWCGTMSFDTAGRTIMGATPADMVKMVETLDTPPLAIGANCGVGISDLLRSVLECAAEGTERPLIAKGNAGMPKYEDGHMRYDITPSLMTDYASLARDAGAKIIGGCCGTTFEHLRAMRTALETRPAGPRPTLEQVTKALGGFSSAADGNE